MEYAMEKAARITAVETRAAEIAWNSAPVLDIGRQTLWSRFFETFGEDPYLASEMGRMTVIGMQGTGGPGERGMAATAKHFPGSYIARITTESGSTVLPIVRSRK